MLTYSKSGVNYHLLDPVKKISQSEGLKTIGNIKNTSVKELTASRGETAYILEGPDCYYATVMEGLGTKNLVADKMREVTGKTYYQFIAQDTVAAIVNDLVTVGARPLTVLAYWAAGDSAWWQDGQRTKDLIKGWKKACDLSCVTWGGGETPSMSDVVAADTINLAGAAFGIIKPKSKIITGEKIKSGDMIIILASNGIHANGLSLARKIASKMPGGYATKLNNGKMFGEDLLRPTVIYTPFITYLLQNNIDIHYIINVTGHGWKKMMRAKPDFTYRFSKVPTVDACFTFIQKSAGISDKEMYATFNMGAGFAIIVDQKEVSKVLDYSLQFRIKAFRAGIVEKGNKKVIIEPFDIVYSQNDLRIS